MNKLFQALLSAGLLLVSVSVTQAEPFPGVRSITPKTIQHFKALVEREQECGPKADSAFYLTCVEEQTAAHTWIYSQALRTDIPALLYGLCFDVTFGLPFKDQKRWQHDLAIYQQPEATRTDVAFHSLWLSIHFKEFSVFHSGTKIKECMEFHLNDLIQTSALKWPTDDEIANSPGVTEARRAFQIMAIKPVDWPTAISWLNRALAKDPQFEPFTRALAMAQSRKG